jgi:hypothetical protein
MTGTSIGLPVTDWMTSTAGAINEAAASRPRRQGERRASPTVTGSASCRIEGCKAAVAHSTDPMSQPASTMCPV